MSNFLPLVDSELGGEAGLLGLGCTVDILDNCGLKGGWGGLGASAQTNLTFNTNQWSLTLKTGLLM